MEFITRIFDHYLFYPLILIAGLSILVVIHELGHFIPAKLFGMRVEKFYLFFDWPRKLFSYTYKGTEYGVGLLPLGGYVKVSGIIDESLDQSTMALPPQPYEFRAKPLWQRAIFMVGGVTMNVLLAILIFTAIEYNQGEARILMAELPYGIIVQEHSIGYDIGLRTGDKILDFKGSKLKYVPDLKDIQTMLLQNNGYFDIEREGVQKRINIPNSYLDKISEKKEDKLIPEFFGPNLPNYIIVTPDIPGAKIGLKTGDRITSINGESSPSYADLKNKLKGKENTEIKLGVLRGTQALEFNTRLDSQAHLGVIMDIDRLKVERIHYNLFQALGPGTVDAFGVIGNQVQGYKRIFNGDVSASKSMAGPVKIAKILGDASKSAGAWGFLSTLGLLSMILAFVNILPIPALDGGHLFFLLIEAVTRREPSIKVRMVAQTVGMLILGGLMLFIIFNDTFQLIFHS